MRRRWSRGERRSKCLAGNRCYSLQGISSLPMPTAGYGEDSRSLRSGPMRWPSRPAGSRQSRTLRRKLRVQARPAKLKQHRCCATAPFPRIPPSPTLVACPPARAQAHRRRIRQRFFANRIPCLEPALSATDSKSRSNPCPYLHPHSFSLPALREPRRRRPRPPVGATLVVARPRSEGMCAAGPPHRRSMAPSRNPGAGWCAPACHPPLPPHPVHPLPYPHAHPHAPVHTGSSFLRRAEPAPAKAGEPRPPPASTCRGNPCGCPPTGTRTTLMPSPSDHHPEALEG